MTAPAETDASRGPAPAEPDGAAGPPSARQRLLRRASTALAAAALIAGLVVAIRQPDWASIRGLIRPSAAVLFAAAALANLAGLVLSMAFWRVLLVDMAGRPVPAGAAMRTYFLGVIAKLAPGRVWSLLLHIRFAASIGMTGKRITGVYLASTVVGLITGAAVGLCVGPALLGARAAWLALPASAVLVLLVRPEAAEALTAALARLLRRPGPVLGASPAAVRRSLILGLISWAVSGLNLWIIVVLLGGAPLRSLPLCIGAFALATVGGSLVFVLPDGWGVRELLVTVALHGALSWSDATVAAVASRVVVLASELLGGLAALAAGFVATRRAAKG